MHLGDAERLAKQLMHYHGLIDQGWSFGFDGAKARLGVTKFSKKLISLSKYMTMYATPEFVEQIMLHEIAHALLPPDAKHGSLWKNKARSIGYTGERTAAHPGPYVSKRKPSKRRSPSSPANKKAMQRFQLNDIVQTLGNHASLSNKKGKIIKVNRTRYIVELDNGLLINAYPESLMKYDLF